MVAVMMFVKEFKPLPVGGAEIQAERLSAYLARGDNPVVIITRRAEGLPAWEEKEGVQIVRVGAWGRGKLQAVFFTLSAALTALRMGKTFDVFHAHLEFSAAMAAILAGRILGKPVIVKYGSSGASSEMQASRRTWWGRLRLMFLRRWADLHIALTKEMETELRQHGFAPERIVRMVNGVDANLFAPTPDKALAKSALGISDRILAVYIGRLTALKALPALLSALARLADALPRLHLLLVGQGEERQALESLAVDLGIEQRLTFAGAVQDVIPYLRAADIFVLPSLGEGISNSLLEAMSCGVACIATRVGGSADALDGGECGVLVEPNNVDQLASALWRLAAEPREAARLGLKARQRILDQYDFDAVGRQYLALYRRLLGIPS